MFEGGGEFRCESLDIIINTLKRFDVIRRFIFHIFQILQPDSVESLGLSTEILLTTKKC